MIRNSEIDASATAMRSNQIRDAERRPQAFRLVGAVPAPEIETPAPAGESARLVASTDDDPYCAGKLRVLVDAVQSYFSMLNEPEMQEWAGTEEGRTNSSELIGDILDDINIFMADCGHLLTPAERRQVERLRGAMGEAQAAMNRSEGLELDALVSMLREFGENTTDLLRTAGGALARVAGGAASAAGAGILFILRRLPTPQPF